MSRFSLLQRALKDSARGGPNRRFRAGKAADAAHDAICCFAFDLLYLDGHDLQRCALLERKGALEALLADGEGGRLTYSDHIEGSGEAFAEQACDHDLEGIVSERHDAPSTPGRSGTWVKSKCLHRLKPVIVGYTDPSGSRTGFGSLLMATRIEGELTYCGRVVTGFDKATLTKLSAHLEKRQRDDPSMDGEVSARERKAAHWVEPELVAEVEFAEWTADRMLPHGRFLGLREDEPPEDVELELPQDAGPLDMAEVEPVPNTASTSTGNPSPPPGGGRRSRPLGESASCGGDGSAPRALPGYASWPTLREQGW